MAWNQPGNNGQDRDPWGSSNNQGGNSGGNGNKGGREQGPPDLDDIFRKLSKKNLAVSVAAKGARGAVAALRDHAARWADALSASWRLPRLLSGCQRFLYHQGS